MQRVLFSIGPVNVYYYGLMLAVGLAVAVFLALREARRKGLNPNQVADFALFSVLAGIAGARLLFVLFALDYYLANPREILLLSAGGMSVYGGLLAGVAVAVWFSRRHSISIWRLGDCIAPSIAIGEAITRIGCDIYGRPGNWPLAINIAGQSYHNIPLYSTIATGLLFAWLWRRRRTIRFDGQLLLEFIVGYSAARFVIEFARDSVMFAGPFSYTQVASAGFILLALGLWRPLARREQVLDLSRI